MSFFKRKSQAFLAASTAMSIASIPWFNFGVTLAAAMVNDAGKLDSFELALQRITLYGSLLYFPALLCLPISLTLMVVSALIVTIESTIETTAGISLSY